MEKIKLMKFSFKSYLIFVSSAAFTLGILLGSFFLVGYLFNFVVNDFFKTTITFFKVNLKEPISNFLGIIIIPVAFLIQGIIISLMSFWGVNRIIRLIKGIELNGNFIQKIGCEALQIKNLSILSIFKITAIIAIVTGIVNGFLIFTCSLFKYDLAVFQSSIFVINLTGPWWIKILKVITIPLQFLFDSLAISIILFWIYNLWLKVTKGITIYGQFQEDDDFIVEK